MNKWVNQEAPKELSLEQAGQLAYMKVQFAPSLAVLSNLSCVSSSAGMFASIAQHMARYGRSLSQCTPDVMKDSYQQYETEFAPEQWSRFMEYFEDAQGKAEQQLPRTMVINASGNDAHSVSGIVQYCANEVKKMPLSLDDEAHGKIADIIESRLEKWLNKRIDNNETLNYPLICKFSKIKMKNVLGDALCVEDLEKLTDSRIKAVQVKVGLALAGVLEQHGQLIAPEQQSLFR